jgi:hypothetical protein
MPRQQHRTEDLVTNGLSLFVRSWPQDRLEGTISLADVVDQCSCEEQWLELAAHFDDVDHEGIGKETFNGIPDGHCHLEHFPRVVL